MMETIKLIGNHQKAAVLLLHGFRGSVGEMRAFAHYLNKKGHTVIVPLYPGHGHVSFKTFLETSIHDWYHCALSYYDELLKINGKVIVIGLSLGGALTLKIGIEKEPHLLITMAAPVIEFTDEQLYDHTKEEIKRHKNLTPFEQTQYYDEYLKMKLDVNEFYKSIREDLLKIKAPIFICQGLDDHQRFMMSSKMINEHVKSDIKQIKYYENVGHVMILSDQKEKIIHDMYNFIEGN